MTHYIGDAARERILQKLVVQMQQRVFDVILQRYFGNILHSKQGEADTASAITEPL